MGNFLSKLADVGIVAVRMGRIRKGYHILMTVKGVERGRTETGFSRKENATCNLTNKQIGKMQNPIEW